MMLRSVFRQAQWWRPDAMELRRRCSSGSMSKADEPSSVRPIRVAALLAKSSASATSVLPTPPCPTMATLRIFVGSSAGILASVAGVDDPEPVESEELVDRLDRRGRRGDQRAEAAGREHPRIVVVLVPDARDEPVDEARVAVHDARLDGMDGVLADHARWPHELHLGQLRRAR